MMRIPAIRSVLMRALILCGLFSQGALISSLIIARSDANPENDQNQFDRSSFVENDTRITTGLQQQEMLAGDLLEQKRQLGQQLLLSGQTYDALKNLVRVNDQLGSKADDKLLFELACCYETAHDLEAARDLYLRICEREDSANPEVNEAAQLGLARTAWHSGDRELAAELFWKKAFSTSTSFEKTCNGDIFHLLGQVVAEQSTGQKQLTMTDENAFVFLSPNFSPEREVTRLIQALENRPSDQAPPEKTKLLQIENVWKVEDNPDGIVLDIVAYETSLLRLFELLSESSKINVTLTDRALRIAQSTYIELRSNTVSLALLLDRATIPYGLSWILTDEGAVQISEARELSSEYQSHILSQSARRLLNKAIIEYPDHDFLFRSKFSLAIVLAQDNQGTNAIATMLDVLESSSDPAIRQYGFFNLAKFYRSMQLPELSEDAMQRVIEAAAVGPLITSALLDVGNMQLGRGELDGAIQSYSRAVRMSNNSDVSGFAAIQLASVYLLMQKPKLAKSVLLETKQHFKDSSLIQYAKYLAALASFREIQSESVFNVDGSQTGNQAVLYLLEALPQTKPIDGMGAHQHLLIAQGWAAIDATTEVTQIINEGLSLSMGDFIRDSLTYELINSLSKDNNIDVVRKLFASLEYSSNKPGSLIQLLSWAKLEYDQRNLSQCQHICEELLNFELDKALLKETLQLLGKIHQSQGKHQLATLYFAGFRPE